MKNWLFTFILTLIINSICLQAQQTSRVFELNDFEFSVRSDGKVFNAEEGNIGLRYTDQEETLHDGIGLTFVGSNASGQIHVASHMIDIEDPSKSGFISGITWYDTNQNLISVHNDYYVVTRSEIEQHIADYEDNGIIDNPIAAIFDWPAYRVTFADSILSTLSLLAPYYDINNNGSYDPDEGEFPIPHSNAEIFIPEIYILKYFSNNLDANIEGGESMDAHGRVEIYGYNCANDEVNLADGIMVKYLIQPYRDQIFHANFSFNNNFSLGDSSNDYLAYDSVSNATFIYNDPLQTETNEVYDNLVITQNMVNDIYSLLEDGGEIAIYQPTILSHYDLDPDKETSGPNNADQLYNRILSGYWNDGTPKTPFDYGYNPSTEEAYLTSFDGNVHQADGWDEISAGNPSGQRNAFHSFTKIRYLFRPSVQYYVNIEKTDDGLPDYQKAADMRKNAEKMTFWSHDFDCYQNPTSTTQIPNIEIQVYPNPTQGIVHLTSSDPILKVELFDEVGRLLSSINYNQKQVTLTLATPGIYFAHITTDQGTHVEKLVRI